MYRTNRLLPTLALGLLLTPLAACDDEPGDSLDAELAERELIVDVQQHLELEHGVELRLVTDPEALEISADESATPILWTEVSDVAPSPAAGTCGPGHWEYKSTKYDCGSCDVVGAEGAKVLHYKQWCWDGPPSCGGCEGWQYTGWSCFSHWCD
ncbi:MAG TPA: hypothetical protein VK034_19945 [Enhygromyxa sp.]|nr:hypothetical protein [Enhygromyxa sp.]